MAAEEFGAFLRRDLQSFQELMKLIGLKPGTG
jgi:hypothetical protein